MNINAIKLRLTHGGLVELLVEDNYAWYVVAKVGVDNINRKLNDGDTFPKNLYSSVLDPIDLKELDPEYKNTTIYLASAFFYDHGGVGRSTPSDLVDTKPTIQQLAQACIMARGKSIDARLIEIMAKKIVDYHELDFDALKEQVKKYSKDVFEQIMLDHGYGEC
jgi:hypothetical protein